MNLETQIKELERKLKLKQAYAAVQFTFGKGYKAFPDDIREEVEVTLKSFAQGVASDGSFKESAGFTAEELEALKLLARSTIKRMSQPTLVVTDKPLEYVAPQTQVERTSAPIAPSSFEDNTMIGRKATLLMLDNIPRHQRNKVASGSEVVIVAKTSVKYQVNDLKGNLFWIPIEDIEMN